MKPMFLITAFTLFFIPSVVNAQHSGIDAALNKGNAADLGVFFSAQVDVSILDSDAALSSNEAVMQLADFFLKNTVKGYKRAHFTAPKNGRSAYSLGDLFTSTGTYRTYLYFDGNQKISEIRIEK